MRTSTPTAALALLLATGCPAEGDADDPAGSTGATDPDTGATIVDTDQAETATPDDTDTTDGPAGTSTSADPSDTDEASSGEPPAGEPVTIAVGYGGMRVRSLDDGHSWQDYTHSAPMGGDDMDLLRGAAWGAGRFVAVGWRLWSSPDGSTWTEHENPTGQWYGAVAYGNDQFLAVGGGGYCARSADGQQWEACTDATDDDGFTHVRSVLFWSGEFYTADASGVLRRSPQGDAWTVVDEAFGSPWAAIVDGAIVPLPEDAPADLPTKRLRGTWGVGIERAEPGRERFVPVFEIPDGNGVFQANRFAFAEGWVE